MKKCRIRLRTIIHAALLMGSLVYWGCTKVAEDTATHPEGWLDPASSNFHSLRVTVAGLESCKQCHGEDLDGGTSRQACTSGICHIRGSEIPHPTGWRLPSTDRFHGSWVLEVGFESCTKCHGADLDGGFTNIACSNGICHTNGASIPHPDGWTTPDEVNFHSNWIKIVGFSSCQDCHGEDFSGGIVNVACSNGTCHAEGDAIPHPTGWTDSTDDAFHGEWVETAGFSSCTACHGSDFSGGWAETSCSNISCHTGGNAIPHPGGWTTPGDEDFHGAWIAVDGYSSCKACHGNDFAGGVAELACSSTSCHTDGDAIPHPEEWTTPGALLFHGEWIKQVGIASCAQCHGSDYSGGFSTVACTNASCHVGGGASPHPVLTEFTDPTHANYHGAILWDNNFDFTDCQDCHGDNLDGGVVEYSCSNATCHTAANGVFACDNCHSSTTSGLPFVNVRNESDTTVASVGLHNSHLGSFRAVRTALVCDDCHEVPASMWATGHIDATPDEAEVPFGNLATHNGILTPSWDHTGGTCSDTYCHGNFAFAQDTSSNPFGYADTVIAGNNTTLNWTQPYSGDNICSLCHGYPPTGHLHVTGCSGCHTTVVGGDNESILDLTKHVNGQKDYP